MSLGISIGVLDGIDKHRRGDPIDCFADVFTYWKQQPTPQSPTNWDTIKVVLQSNCVGEKDLSDSLGM